MAPQETFNKAWRMIKILFKHSKPKYEIGTTYRVKIPKIPSYFKLCQDQCDKCLLNQISVGKNFKPCNMFNSDKRNNQAYHKNIKQKNIMGSNPP